MQKNLKKPGKNTLAEAKRHVEVQNISLHGMWVFVRGQEFFLSFDLYPWFHEATVKEICDVHFLHEKHLHWPMLDVDLSLDSLKNPEAFPLVYKKNQ